MPSIEMPQLTVTQFPNPAIEGMIADTSAISGNNTISRLAQGALHAGRGVCKGTLYEQVKLPALASDVTDHFQGFTTYNAMREPVAAGPLYKDTDAVGIFRRGPIWLLAEGTVIDDGPVYIVNGTGAGTPGMLRGDANSGAATVMPRAKVIKGATAGNLALVEINLV